MTLFLIVIDNNLFNYINKTFNVNVPYPKEGFKPDVQIIIM